VLRCADEIKNCEHRQTRGDKIRRAPPAHVRVVPVRLHGVRATQIVVHAAGRRRTTRTGHDESCDAHRDKYHHGAGANERDGRGDAAGRAGSTRHECDAGGATGDVFHESRTGADRAERHRGGGHRSERGGCAVVAYDCGNYFGGGERVVVVDKFSQPSEVSFGNWQSHEHTKRALGVAQDVAQTLVQNFEQLRQVALTVPGYTRQLDDKVMTAIQVAQQIAGVKDQINSLVDEHTGTTLPGN
jgi:hypothetical protein